MAAADSLITSKITTKYAAKTNCVEGGSLLSSMAALNMHQTKGFIGLIFKFLL